MGHYVHSFFFLLSSTVISRATCQELLFKGPSVMSPSFTVTYLLLGGMPEEIVVAYGMIMMRVKVCLLLSSCPVVHLYLHSLVL